MIGKLLAGMAVAVSLVFVAPLAAGAKTAKVPGLDRPVSVEVPDDWTVKTVERGLEVKSHDEEIFLWIESYFERDLEKVKAEHGKYFAEQGIKVTGEAKITSHSMSGYGLAFLDLPATWEDDPTVLRYIMIEPADAARKRIIVSYWASPEADKAYDRAMSTLIESLAKSLAAAN